MVATSSATSTRHASITTSCVALAKAPIPASSEKTPSEDSGSSSERITRIAPSNNCAVTIHCLRLPSFLSPGRSTRSKAGDHRNLNA